MKSKSKIILFSLFLMKLVDQPTPELIIEQGILSGKVSEDGSFFEYLGIPYASTNSSTRFQAPLPPPTWKGVFKAIDETIQCPQFSPAFPFTAVCTEDCLKINVYVPVMAEKPLPVMVYVHGGAFILGNGGKLMYAPDHLLNQDVIVVTFNYRLGTLGFLCLGIKEAPGNAGMKDQVAALRWVKKNIAAFGGNPDNITILGHSAGGTSVSLLVASDMTKGLFNRAIVGSGSSLANWSVNKYPVLVARQIAKSLGYNTEDPKELHDIFSKASLKDLVKATAGIPIGQLLTSQLLHLPCVEKNIFGVEPFLNDLPYNILMNNPRNISIIYGSTDREGLLFVGEETDASLKASNKRNLFCDDLEFKSEEENLKVNQEVKEFYFGNEDISRKTLMNLSELYSDLYFSVPVMLEAELMTEVNKANIYNYYFTYSGGRNLIKSMYGFSNESGACHGDDILYLFKSSLLPFKPKGQDKIMIEWMTKMFTNFAKYGNPTPQSDIDLPVTWTPNNENRLNVLIIGNELKMSPIPTPEAYLLWKDIYSKYRKVLLD